MELFTSLKLRFENPLWAKHPALVVIDTLLECQPELLLSIKDDVLSAVKESPYGRKDSPTVEQILRLALYKELKGLDYRGLELDLYDSRICAAFVQLDDRKPFTYSVLHKYISRIKPESLQKLMVAINQTAIDLGLEKIEDIRIDTTVVATNIHYPTNNGLVWDSIRKLGQCLKAYYQQQDKDEDANNKRISARIKEAKKVNFQIANTKNTKSQPDAQQKLFELSLPILQDFIAESRMVLTTHPAQEANLTSLGHYLPLAEQVYCNAYQFQIEGMKVANEDKLCSIFETHTDIIVKGVRDVTFGHKVNLVGGRSNLILAVAIPEGNPADSTLYQQSIETLEVEYKKCPSGVVTDGGYASLANAEFAQGKHIVNIVFNKIVGSLKSIAESVEKEAALKKWRSGMEAVISNWKRGFDMRVCEWKGKIRFDSRVLWAVIGYNLRVLGGHLIKLV
jgi:IS5 family transposase